MPCSPRRSRTLDADAELPRGQRRCLSRMGVRVAHHARCCAVFCVGIGRELTEESRTSSVSARARHNDEMIHQALRCLFDATHEICLRPPETSGHGAVAGGA